MSIADTITKKFNELLAQRDKIDSLIEQIGSLLGSSFSSGKRRGRPAGKKLATGPKGKRKRRTFAVTGEELVLMFIKSNSGATTKNVNAHWKSKGRSGTADNMLTKLIKEKKLKRTKNKDGGGSSYSVM